MDPRHGILQHVNPTTISQKQYNGRVDAEVTQKRPSDVCHLLGQPVDSTNYNGPMRAANLWHHSQVNDAFFADLEPHLLADVAESGARQRGRMAVERNQQQPTGAFRTAAGQYRRHRGVIGRRWRFSSSVPGAEQSSTSGLIPTTTSLTKILGQHSIKTGGELPGSTSSTTQLLPPARIHLP